MEKSGRLSIETQQKSYLKADPPGEVLEKVHHPPTENKYVRFVSVNAEHPYRHVTRQLSCDHVILPRDRGVSPVGMVGRGVLHDDNDDADVIP